MLKFCNSHACFLGPNEHIKADDGYLGEALLEVKCPSSFTNPVECEHMQQKVWACQEPVNKQLNTGAVGTKDSVIASPSMLIFSQWGLL